MGEPERLSSPPPAALAQPGPADRGALGLTARAILRELALAVGVAAVLAVSPFTPEEWGQSAVAGAVVGAGVFAWRIRRLRHAEPPAVERARAVARVPALLWLSAALWVAVFAPTFAWMYRAWTNSIWTNNHGLFIPFFVAYLVVTTLRSDRRPESRESSAWGLPLVAAGVLLAAADAAVQTSYLAAAGLLLSLPGLALLLLGRRRARALAVPMVVSLLMVPIPNSLASHLYLRQGTAMAVEPILHALGIPAFREMTVIQMAQHVFIVSNACSGFATLYASIAVALILACYTPSWKRRAALLLAAPLLAFSANVLRVLMLILLTDGMGSWVIESPLHPGSGVAAFFLALVGLFAIADRNVLRGRTT